MHDPIKPGLLKSSIFCQLPKSEAVSIFQEFFIAVLHSRYQNLNQSRLYQRNQTNMRNVLRDLLQKKKKKTKKKKLPSLWASQIVRLNGNMVISPLLNLSNDSTKLCNPSRNSVLLWFGIL